MRFLPDSLFMIAPPGGGAGWGDCFSGCDGNAKGLLAA
jgi:hypothetical protein